MIRSHSYIATPPGATIKEQLKDRGMSQKEFSARMDMSEKHISKLINGEVILTHDVAMRLEMVLGLPAHFWNNLESIYREKLVLVENENEMDKDLAIAKKFPFKEMQENGWIEPAEKASDKVFSLRKFFEVVSLSKLQESLVPSIACRRQSVTEKADFALLAWAQKAKLEARSIVTKPINLKHFEEIIPSIRKMTIQKPEYFCKQLCEMLADCGIALVFLPHIGGSYLHGATFYDKKRIVVGLTVRGKDADKFWFSLFHEIAHILYGHISNPEGTTEEEELLADKFARDTLIPKNEFQKYIQAGIFNEKSIRDFADMIDIDVGIVVGRLQKDGHIKYNRFNYLKTKYSI